MKRFLIKSFLLAIPVLLIIAYPNVFKFKTSGDLGALGYVFFDDSYRMNFVKDKALSQAVYCQSVKKMSECEEVSDILVIGDSFAHTEFQDYLSEIKKKNVTTLYHTINTEALDIYTTLMKEKRDLIPQVVIVESVERLFISRMSKMSLDTVLNVDSIYYQPTVNTKTYIEKAQDFYKKKVGLDNPVNSVKLSKELFTCKNQEKTLYFYSDDLYVHTEIDVKKAFDNLELLHNYAYMNGVYLIFMVAADKYDVYQKFIVENPYGPNDILSKGICFDSLPYFINTKCVLTEAAENGVKDIYWADDTHWSPVGAKIVAKEIARRLDSLGILR